MSIQYIDSPDQIENLCRQIANEPWIALDTEFLREKTYYPKFCLLQIAAPGWVACVDPLAITDLSALFEAIYQPNIVKVLHSCRQDLEIFYQITGKIPGPIFDTQIAAPLLGFQENPGYAMLVSSFLNVNLSKAHTRTDWSERPLSADQIQYAADDVIYLCQIYTAMCEQLAALGRLHWLESDFALLNNPELYQLSPENAWLKIRGKNKLTGKQLSIMQSLSEWRERTAQQENKPRNWLMQDDMLLELAKLQPVTLAELAKIRNINERTVNRYGKALCALVEEARQRPPKPMAGKENAVKKNQQHEAILDVLSAVVRIRAEENSLNPVILASRKDLEQLLFGDEDCLLLHGWRYNMAGRELQGLLQGDYSLSLKPEGVVISAA
ncbi:MULTISPECIES: ribonuclease D [Methylomonas]|uniref:Ribonuclease D n=1 Tax=Methylomonas koyamae TaxID=702114 RepID=A0AA91I6L5_9GAMM|nr:MULTISPECIES: ribonuclease D [Methylomonas]ANE54968.1 ribonuclease D [Methylomonas sp. DH-1]OAI29049.1 ribonuclease D [Methylomonas koyamae]BBL59356.1 ribonuclease D [Methylomonas koyamae]